MAEATCGSPEIEIEIELNSTKCLRRHINDDGFYFLELSFFSSDFTRGLLWARGGGVGLRGCIERPIHILLHASRSRKFAAQNARFSTIISHTESEEKERRPATAVHRHGYQSHMQVPRVLSHSGSG